MKAFVCELSARDYLVDEFDEGAWYAVVADTLLFGWTKR